jgi:uncharacterized Zn finger protein
MPIRPLDESAIRALASRESFERGRDYWRRGAVANLVRRGEELTADVQGSDLTPYHVRIRLQDSTVTEAHCTCPYEWGGCCKHIVATLLAVADDPAAVIERPPFRDLLKALDRDTLIDLILKRLPWDPELAGWLEAELAASPRQDRQTPVDPAPLAAHAHAVLAGRSRPRRYWDEVQPSGDAAELRALVEKAVPFLEAGDGRNALRILETITDAFVEDWLAYASDTDEHLYTLFPDLGRMMAEAVLMTDLTPEERDDLAATLGEWQDDLADYGLDEGFGVAIQALESGWDDPALQAVLAGDAAQWPPADRADEDEDELIAVRLRVLDASGRTDAYLNLARAAGASTSVATMLVKLDRVPEALAYARDTFTTPGEALALAKALREAGWHDEALTIAHEGLRRSQNETDETRWWSERPVVTLAQWLRGYAADRGHRDFALTAAQTAFEQTHSLADYQAVKAQAGKSWKDLSPDLLDHLTAAAHAPDRVEILLHEGLIAEAVRSVGEAKGYETSDAVLLQLMDVASASHPDWVIRLAEHRASQIMDSGAAGSYDLATQWLQRAAAAYDAAGRIDEWTARIEALIGKHRRKYKLRPLLEALRYGA